MTRKQGNTFEVGFGTDTGRIRDHNEDRLYVDKEAGLFIVADGLGGHQAGEVASRVAVETIKDHFDSIPPLSQDCKKIEDAARDAIQAANHEICTRSIFLEELHGMGTTVVLALVKEDRVYVAHVGDSRAYLLRNETLKQLTEDHSVVARMVRAGELDKEEARHHYLRSSLYRALGKDETVDVDTLVYNHQPGDTLLLCSDGLTDMLEDEEIKDNLPGFSSPQKAGDRLIAMANEKGGKDNITVIVVKFDEK